MDKVNGFDPLGYVFSGIFAVLLVLAYLVFYRGRDAVRKRQWLPYFAALPGLVFLTFIYLLRAPVTVYYVAVPGVACITFLNIRMTRFCGECGAHLFLRGRLAKMARCPRCGADPAFPGAAARG